jgi:Ca2+-binding RTX toxin-like protein
VRLFNYGSILAPIDVGAEFSGDNVIVTNGPEGLISGLFGVAMGGSNALVANEGAIDASFVGVTFQGGSNVGLVNSGTITAMALGVSIETVAGESKIVNLGTIGGFGAGINVATAAGLVTSIHNDGVIRGGAASDGTGAAIVSDSGSVALNNFGQIDGGIELAAADGNDFIVNHGVVRGAIALGAGNDIYDGAEGVQRFVFGEDGDDDLFGGDEDEIIDGGAGDDALSGGLGNDLLIGGTGADTFLFITAPDKKTNQETIDDFSSADGDKIALDRDIFTHLGKEGELRAKYFDIGKKPETKNDRIVYNDKKGVLLYAEKGSKTDKSDWVKFAKVDKGTDLDHSDILLI